MRRSFNDTGWILDQQSNVLGFSLGFDFCSEHEWGANYLRSALGITHKNNPVGIEERSMTALRSQDLHLIEYVVRTGPKDQKQNVPHAILALSSLPASWPEAPKHKKDWATRLMVGFQVEAESKYYDAQKHDIAVVWSGTKGFAMHVRGDQNIERLKALHAAFFSKDIALMDASAVGFLRKALALVMPSKVPQDIKDNLKSGDLGLQRLLTAAQDSGIAEELRLAGCGYYALSPAWRRQDEATGELIFFLNPEDQRKNAFGWFGLADLRQWIKGEGPIVEGLSAKAALEAQHGDNYRYDLVHKANGCGIFLNNTTEVWLDKVRTQPGSRVLFSPVNETVFDDGAYSLTELHEMLDTVKAQLTKPKAMRP